MRALRPEVLTLVLAGCAHGGSTMLHDDTADFERRVGIASVGGANAPHGVAASWDVLPDALSTEIGHLRLRFAQLGDRSPGVGEGSWDWEGDQKHLSVRVLVSGVSPADARRLLVEQAAGTMMVRIPFERGPANLGDFSVQGNRPGSQVVLWAFRNVCVEVDNAGTAVAVEPVARAIQRFMEAHQVVRVADYLPRVEAIDVSSAAVAVGENLRIGVRLPRGVPRESLITSLDETGDKRFKALENDGLVATYEAVRPGHATFDIRIVSRRTLLSPLLHASVEVLPRIP